MIPYNHNRSVCSVTLYVFMPFFLRKNGDSLFPDLSQRLDIRSVLDRMPLLITQEDASGHFTYWNTYAERMTGYFKKEVIGKMGPDDFHVKIGEAQHVRREIDKKGMVMKETTWKTKDGKTVSVRINVTSTKNAETKAQYVGFVQDITEQVKERNLLRQAEEQFHNLAEHSLQGIILARGLPVEIVYANKTVAKMLGYSLREFIKFSGDRLEVLIHPDDRFLFFERYRNRLLGKRFLPNYEFRAIHKNGETRWFEIYSVKTTFRGEPAIQATFFDITDRKRAEEALRFSEVRFHKLFETAQDGILLLDMATSKILDVNKSFVKLLGYTKRKLTGRIPWQCEFFKDPEQAQKAFERLKQRGREHCELVLATRSGKKIIGEFVSNQYSMDHARVAHCNVRDVTAQKEMRNILEMERKKYDSILQNIGECVIVIDDRGRMIFINRATTVLLGWRVKRMIGEPLSRWWRVTDETHPFAAQVCRPIQKVMREGCTITTTISEGYYCEREDGNRFPIVMTVSPVIEQGRPVNTIIVFRDVTYEYEIDKMKTEFVSLASHQFRTPTSSIQWNTEILLNGDAGQLTKEQREIIQDMERSNHRTIDLVNMLLSVSHLELGAFVIEPESIDVRALFKALLSDMQPVIARKKLRVQVVFSGTVKRQVADKKLMRILFENILSNAIKYSRTGGRIDVRIRKKDHGLFYAVKDQGIGIPKEQQASIFQKLFRAENARKHDPDGSGLGLYLVKLVLDRIGGRISMISKEECGSTFSLSIPSMKKRKGKI